MKYSSVHRCSSVVFMLMRVDTAHVGNNLGALCHFFVTVISDVCVWSY